MKFTLGVLFLAAGHVLNVHSLAIRSADDSLDGDSTQKSQRAVIRDHFQARSPQQGNTDTGSLNIQTIIGTADASTSTFDGTSITLPTGLVTDTVTTGTDTATAVAS